MDIHNQILTKLTEIEQEQRVRIIYACESGSRAWAFPSTDSDYDVRFIYVHPTPWYLGISQKRDVIDVPVGPILDINGWDVRKTLSLLRKSNGPLLEWLTSPIVYHEHSQVMEFLKNISQQAFLAKTVCWHYLAMAKGMMETVNSTDQPRIKTYLYALRSVLCCLWIIEMKTQPPVLFQILKENLLTSGRIMKLVEMILDKRAAGGEKETITRLSELDEYLYDTMLWISENIPENTPGPDLEIYDQAFRDILQINV